MRRTPSSSPAGLSAFALKLLALFAMTLDHLAAYGSAFPFFARWYTPLRILGRIAAPVFLFLLTESARQTKDRRKFLLRLYLAGAGTELFTTAVNLLFGTTLGVFTADNILFTFFFTVFYIHLAEELARSRKAGNRKRTSLLLLIFAVSFLPNFLPEIPGTLPLPQLINGLRKSVLPASLSGKLDYGLPFMILGIALYFAKTKERQCRVFAGFWILCALGWAAGAVFPGFYGLPYVSVFCNSLQLWMILALPLLRRYNGQRGRSLKSLFYIYYPLHRYAIFVIAALLE